MIFLKNDPPGVLGVLDVQFKSARLSVNILLFSNLYTCCLFKDEWMLNLLSASLSILNFPAV